MPFSAEKIIGQVKNTIQLTYETSGSSNYETLIAALENTPESNDANTNTIKAVLLHNLYVAIGDHRTAYDLLTTTLANKAARHLTSEARCVPVPRNQIDAYELFIKNNATNSSNLDDKIAHLLFDSIHSTQLSIRGPGELINNSLSHASSMNNLPPNNNNGSPTDQQIETITERSDATIKVYDDALKAQGVLKELALENFEKEFMLTISNLLRIYTDSTSDLHIQKYAAEQINRILSTPKSNNPYSISAPPSSPFEHLPVCISTTLSRVALVNFIKENPNLMHFMLKTREQNITNVLLDCNGDLYKNALSSIVTAIAMAEQIDLAYLYNKSLFAFLTFLYANIKTAIHSNNNNNNNNEPLITNITDADLEKLIPNIIKIAEYLSLQDKERLLLIQNKWNEQDKWNEKASDLAFAFLQLALQYYAKKKNASAYIETNEKFQSLPPPALFAANILYKLGALTSKEHRQDKLANADLRATLFLLGDNKAVSTPGNLKILGLKLSSKWLAEYDYWSEALKGTLNDSLEALFSKLTTPNTLDLEVLIDIAALLKLVASTEKGKEFGQRYVNFIKENTMEGSLTASWQALWNNKNQTNSSRFNITLGFAKPPANDDKVHLINALDFITSYDIGQGLQKTREQLIGKRPQAPINVTPSPSAYSSIYRTSNFTNKS